MDTRTNDLYASKAAALVAGALAADLVKVPKRLDRAARKALKGQKRVKISRDSGGKLSQFAADRRRAKKNAARRRAARAAMEKATRKAQRKGR